MKTYEIFLALGTLDEHEARSKERIASLELSLQNGLQFNYDEAAIKEFIALHRGILDTVKTLREEDYPVNNQTETSG